MQYFSHKFTNTHRSGNTALSAAVAHLKRQRGYSGDIELALAEAINNVVVHAYKHSKGFGEVEIEQNTSGELVCTVTDRGRGFRKTKPYEIAKRLEHARPYGHGWFLVTQLAKSTRRSISNKGNAVQMVFSI